MLRYMMLFLTVVMGMQLKQNSTYYPMLGINATLDGPAGFKTGDAPSTESRVNMNIPGVKLSYDLLMQIADANKADYVNTDDASGDNHGVGWFTRDSAATTYLSTSRCGQGRVGTHVQSTSGGVYKKCFENFDHFDVRGQFTLPPFLCQQTCDEDNDCVGYIVNNAQNQCTTLFYSAQYSRYTMLFRVG